MKPNTCLLAQTFAAALSLVGCSAPHPNSVNIGAILSLSGAAAPYGEDNRRGLEIAEAVISERGGVLGKPLRLIIQDSAGESAQAVALARRFADDSGVLAILGPTRTGETVAVAKLLPDLRVPLVSVGSTGDWQAAAGAFNEWTFRSTRVDTYLIEPLLRSARDRFGVRTLAILSTANDDYSASVLPVYERAAADLGLTVVAKESQKGGDTDRSPQLSNIKASRADALIINTLSSDAPAIAEQARRLGITSRFIGTAGFSNPATWKLASENSLEGTLLADNFFVGSTRPAVAEFVRRYRDKYKGDPPAYAAYAYDGLLLVADAARRAGANATRDSLRSALGSTDGFEGVLGRLTYHGSGDAAKPAVIMTISKGALSLVQ